MDSPKKLKRSARGGKRPNSGRKPGTTNKATRALKEIASEYTEAAIKTLAKIMDDPEAPAAARVAAADKLLDRGHGKPTQMVEATLEQKGIDPKDLQARYVSMMERSVSRQIEIANERRGILGDDQADQMIEDANQRLSKLKSEASQ